jgi:hypothetical protein
MKTITFNTNNVSAYIFDDTCDIVITTNNITCPHFVIGDMNSMNSTLHEDVSPPEDWVGGRYTFDGTTWTEVVDGSDGSQGAEGDSGWPDPSVPIPDSEDW